MRHATFRRLNLPIHSVRDLPAPRRTRTRTGHEGRGLETLILSSQTSVRLTKIPLSARRLAGGAIMAASGPVDFMGGHKPTGQLIIFDAKQTKTQTRLPTGKKQLAEHQRLEICAYGQDGFLAGLLCECTATRRLYWCDWRKISRRRPSVPWSEMTDIGPSTHAVEWEQIVKASMFAEVGASERSDGESTSEESQEPAVLAVRGGRDVSGASGVATASKTPPEAWRPGSEAPAEG